MTTPPEITDGVIKKGELDELRAGRGDFVRALFLCLLAVVAVRSFLFEPFKIPSSSMVPSLKIGDHIFVSKFNYGLSIPFTKFEFARWSAPQRGDVIVFLFPRDEALHYVKRVVGVPGDTVEIRGKDLLVNGEPVAKDLITDEAEIKIVSENIGTAGELYKENLDGVAHYIRFSKKAAHDLTREAPPVIVPEDKYFVLGDNRDDSYDSRSWGFVPRENVKGKAQLIWLSLDSEKKWGAVSKIRWARCGTLVQ